jgi:hypothetical protein
MAPALELGLRMLSRKVHRHRDGVQGNLQVQLALYHRFSRPRSCKDGPCFGDISLINRDEQGIVSGMKPVRSAMLVVVAAWYCDQRLEDLLQGVVWHFNFAWPQGWVAQNEWPLHCNHRASALCTFANNPFAHCTLHIAPLAN